MKSLYVVIVGCGRLGSLLANDLSRQGHRVVVVDRDERAFANLQAEAFSGFRVEGDAAEAAVLGKAGVQEANVVIAVTREDSLNFMVALVASKIFGVRHVMARVYDPRREDLYQELGLQTVCPTLLAGEAFSRLIQTALDGNAPSP